MVRYLFLFLALASLLAGCDSLQPHPDTLPILGQRDVVDGDTVYHQIRDFSFVDQDSQLVTNATFAGKAYIADFFFISCPSICPLVTKQMLRVYDKFQGDPRLDFLSHTIDPKRDTVGRLRNYARNLGVNTQQWHFVTGAKDSLFSIAEDYFSIALENEDAPGGFDHSGRLLLIDKNRHIRAFCDGTDPASVDHFMEDIDALLREMAGEKVQK